METLRDKYNAAIEENNSLSVRIDDNLNNYCCRLESKYCFR